MIMPPLKSIAIACSIIFTTVHAHAARSELWRLRGYYVDGQTQLFSLQKPDGKSLWMERGVSENPSFVAFDESTKLLVIRVDGQELRLVLEQSHIAEESEYPKITESTQLQTPVASDTEQETAKSIKERRIIATQVARIERQEIKVEKIHEAIRLGEQLARNPGELGKTVPVNAAQNEAHLASSIAAPDWIALRKQADKRRILLEAKWARGKLDETGNQ
jgi:hypothetical protein